MRILINAFLVFSLLLSPATGKDEDIQFDGQKMLEYIKILADDSMEGRKSGLPGGEKAALYIIEKLEEWGIEPAGDNGTYKQPFILEDFFSVEPGSCLEIAPNENRKRSFHYNDYMLRDEWTVCTHSGSGDIEAEIVFAGYGIHAPDQGYDVYADVDVRGKLVMITHGIPAKLAPKLGEAIAPEARVKAAQNLGAKGMIVFPRPAEIGQEYPYPAFFSFDKEAYDPGFVVIGISPEVASYIFFYLAEETNLLIEDIDSTSKPQSFNTGVKASLRVKTVFDESRETFNVLGKISGRDSRLKEEVLILGAHMDHLGVSPLEDVFNGAYDNASGTAVVMEVARLMKLHGMEPKRTILFALWAAEEQGLLGSKHYVSHPVYPLEKTVANLNLDCVGRGQDEVLFGCTYLSGEVWDVIEQNIPEKFLEGIRPRRGVGGSDQLAFLAEGVHGFHMVSSSRGRKIHHPADDWDLINVDLLEKSARFLYHASDVLAKTEKNILFPGRSERILLKRENMVNYCPLPSAYVLERFETVENSEVDMQLIYPELEAKDSPSLKLEVAEFLEKIPMRVKKAPGLALYGEDQTSFLRSRARRTRLLVGLKGTATFEDDPAWLSIFAKLGLKYVILGEEDIRQDIIQAANKAKVLLIFWNLSEAQMKACLEAAKTPSIFVTSALPSDEHVDLVKAGRHALGLTFRTGESAEEYYHKLMEAKKNIGFEHVILWNESSLWEEKIHTKYLELFTWFIQAEWIKEDETRQPIMSKITSRNFITMLRRMGI